MQGATLGNGRHIGLFGPPALVAGALIALLVLWVTGSTVPWLQAALFIGALLILGFAFLDMLVRDIRHAHLHSIGVRAITLGVMVLETLALFSLTYLAISQYNDQMKGLQTPLDALYFTMTTLMTIGFGDITADGQIARGTVLVQMFFSVVLLSASVRLLSSLTRGVTRQMGHHREAQEH